MYFEYNGITVITKANWLDAGLTEGQYKKDSMKKKSQRIVITPVLWLFY